jgi:hypothetical protein
LATAGRTPPWITTTWPASYHSRLKISPAMYDLLFNMIFIQKEKLTLI